MNNSLTYFDNFFYNEAWPDYFFVNSYPLLVVLWNIILLFIPFFLCSLLIMRWQKSGFKKISQKAAAVIIGFIWLLFIPNTAYIITDMRHIFGYCPANLNHVCAENAWMIIFFFIYASIGWISFVFLLNQMKGLIIDIWDGLYGKIFIYLMIPLVSLGVLLGLLNRFNSWDFFFFPLEISKAALVYFTNLIYFSNWAFFTTGLYALYFIGNWLFKDNYGNRLFKNR